MYRFFSPHIQMESLQNSEPFVPQKQKKNYRRVVFM